MVLEIKGSVNDLRYALIRGNYYSQQPFPFDSGTTWYVVRDIQTYFTADGEHYEATLVDIEKPHAPKN